MAVDRTIPTSRLKTFFETWIDENWEEDKKHTLGKRGVGLLAFRAGIDPRRVNVILNEEVANVTFDFADKVFTNLDCIHYWHTSPEYGGFSDYYRDEIPERVPETPDQFRRRILEKAKKQGRKSGRHWLDVLHEKALEEIAA